MEEIKVHKYNPIVEALSKGEKLYMGRKEELFKEGCEKLETENQNIPPKNEKMFRIMSYNVKKWSDINGSNNVNSVLKIIDHLQPDLFVLVESSEDCFSHLIIQRKYKVFYCKARSFSYGNMICYKEENEGNNIYFIFILFLFFKFIFFYFIFFICF